MFPQKSHQDNGLFICLGQYTRSSFIPMLKQVFDERLIHIFRLIAYHFNPTLFFSHGDNWCTFYPFMYIFQKSVGKIHRLACTAVIFGHFDKRASAFLCQSVHITGIGTAKFIDVLVIVSHCYHTHLLIISH